MNEQHKNNAQLMQQRYGKVAVLLGGSSAERDVSLASGKAIYQALINKKVAAVKIDPRDGLLQQLKDNKIERVFIALHGRGGEDGEIQGLLKALAIPFTGTDAASASLSMNKLLSKQVWQYKGFDTAQFESVSRNLSFNDTRASAIFEKLGPVLFVKPISEGSSVGMSKVNSSAQLVEAVALAHQFDQTALVERFIDGQEYTVGILAGRALPSISMRTPREFYDYQAKYEATTTEYFCPSGLSEESEQQLRELALSAFSALGCSGWGRVDFIRDRESGRFLLLEANTVPGMTQSSLVPKAAKAAGIDFGDLVLQILDTSFAAKEATNG